MLGILQLLYNEGVRVPYNQQRRYDNVELNYVGPGSNATAKLSSDKYLTLYDATVKSIQENSIVLSGTELIDYPEDKRLVEYAQQWWFRSTDHR